MLNVYRSRRPPGLPCEGQTFWTITFIGYLEIHGITVPQKGVVGCPGPLFGDSSSPSGHECHYRLLGRIVSKLGLFELLRQLRARMGTHRCGLSSGSHGQFPRRPRRYRPGCLSICPFYSGAGARLLSGLGCPLRRMDQKIGYSSSPIWTVRMVARGLSRCSSGPSRCESTECKSLSHSLYRHQRLARVPR